MKMNLSIFTQLVPDGDTEMLPLIKAIADTRPTDMMALTPIGELPKAFTDALEQFAVGSDDSVFERFDPRRFESQSRLIRTAVGLELFGHKPPATGGGEGTWVDAVVAVALAGEGLWPLTADAWAMQPFVARKHTEQAFDLDFWKSKMQNATDSKPVSFLFQSFWGEWFDSIASVDGIAATRGS